MTMTTINVCDISTITTDFGCEVDPKFKNPDIKGEKWTGLGFGWKEFKLPFLKKRIMIPYPTVKEYIREEETHVYTECQCYYREFGHPYTEKDLRKIGRKIDMEDKKVHYLPWIIIRLKSSGRIHKIAFDTIEEANKAFDEYNRMLAIGQGIITVETF